MSNVPQIPNLTGGSEITIKERKILSLDCPKCNEPMDVTNLRFGTNLECPSCKNVTWRPEFKPHWWFRFRNFFFSMVVSFALGVLASITASYIYDTLNSETLTEQNRNQGNNS